MQNKLTTADTFLSANPEATLALIDFGHGYGTAKYDSTCRLTGDRINRGESTRKVAIRTATGHTFEGYVSNRMFALLQFRGEWGCPHRGDWNPSVSRWTRFDLAKVEAALENAETGTTIRLILRDSGYGSNETRGWTLGANGKWRQGRKTSSPKALLAALRRSKRAILLLVESPEGFSLNFPEDVRDSSRKYVAL
jgi:hypothetical protein